MLWNKTLFSIFHQILVFLASSVFFYSNVSICASRYVATLLLLQRMLGIIYYALLKIFFCFLKGSMLCVWIMYITFLRSISPQQATTSELLKNLRHLFMGYILYAKPGSKMEHAQIRFKHQNFTDRIFAEKAFVFCVFVCNKVI